MNELVCCSMILTLPMKTTFSYLFFSQYNSGVNPGWNRYSLASHFPHIYFRIVDINPKSSRDGGDIFIQLSIKNQAQTTSFIWNWHIIILYWWVANIQKAITCTNVVLLSVRSFEIHLRALQSEDLKIPIRKTEMKITDLAGINELISKLASYFAWAGSSLIKELCTCVPILWPV